MSAQPANEKAPDLVTIEIDGKSMDVPKGSMIIEAADKAGITIPRFCYHRKLSIAANCRMCMVDVENGRPPDAQAGAGLRHAGGRWHEGADPLGQGVARAAQCHGIPADQPSAGLPDLRSGRRMRVAGCVAGLRPFGQPLYRAQAHHRRREPGFADRHRDDALHPVHALCALHGRDRRHLRAGWHEPWRSPGNRHLHRQVHRKRDRRQHHRCLPGRRADQQAVPVQGPRLGTDRPPVRGLPRCARFQPLAAHAPG